MQSWPQLLCSDQFTGMNLERVRQCLDSEGVSWMLTVAEKHTILYLRRVAAHTLS